MADSNQSFSDQTTQDASNAISVGKSAANIAKSAAKIASGDIAGGVVNLAKDENVRSLVAIILIPALLLFFVVTMVLYSFPLTVYEGIQQISDTVAEAYRQGLYAGDQSELLGFFNGIGNAISALHQEIWGWVKGASNVIDGESATEEDMQIAASQEALNNVTLKKLQFCQDKIDARVDSIKNEITYGSTASAIYGYFYNKFLSSYPEDYIDANNVLHTFDYSVNISCSSGRRSTQSDALKLMALYSVMNNQDIEDLKVSDFLKWLGYRDGVNAKSLYFDIAPISGSAPYNWGGTFLPQYLLDEMKDRILSNPDIPESEIRREYEKYMCSAVDLCIQVSAPELYSIQGVEEISAVLNYIPEYDEETDTYIYQENVFGNTIPYKTMKTTVTYSVPITVSVRGIKNIIKVAGLMSGDISSERREALQIIYGEQQEEDTTEIETPALEGGDTNGE